MSARTSAAAVDARSVADHTGQRVVIHGVPWRTCTAIRELLDSPGLRMTYIEGTLELMTPGLDLDVLLRFATREDQHQSLREYRDLVRAG